MCLDPPDSGEERQFSRSYMCLFLQALADSLRKSVDHDYRYYHKQKQRVDIRPWCACLGLLWAQLLACGAQEESIMRKKFFNMMEDMKGKIRVYARVRPMLSFEKERGQKVALNIPDELTLDHIWKEKKREYQFDAVFEPVASQEKVRACTPADRSSVQATKSEHIPAVVLRSTGSVECMRTSSQCASIQTLDTAASCLLYQCYGASIWFLTRVPSPAQVFEDTRHLVQSAVDGYNVCIFAYGQTGSGKTHTIYGMADMPGLTPRGIHELFNILDRDSGKYTFSVSCYMLELYQDDLADLLLPVPKVSTPHAALQLPPTATPGAGPIITSLSLLLKACCMPCAMAAATLAFVLNLSRALHCFEQVTLAVWNKIY